MVIQSMSAGRLARPAEPTERPAEGAPLATEYHGDDVVEYRRDQAGKLDELHTGEAPKSSQGIFGKLFLPSNMPDSVSADYVPSRRWAFVRDMAESVGNYFGTASALNAVGIGSGPLTVGMAWMFRDAIDGVGKFAGSFYSKQADRDPKSWTMRGDYINTAGVLLETSLSVVPGGFLGIAPAAQILKAYGSTTRNAANAPIEIHQARGNNLGEVRSKNGNQNMVSGGIGGALGFGLELGGKSLLGPAAVPVMAAGAAAVRLFAANRYVAALDLDQVTESSVGKVVHDWVRNGEVPTPEPTGLKSTFSRAHRDLKKIELGSSLKPFVTDEQRFSELTELYAGRDYLLDVEDGKVEIALRQGSDERTQLEAMIQAIILKMLQHGQAYRDRKASAGESDADRWAVETSLRATPEDPTPLLDEMRRKGWEVDDINFGAESSRSQWQSPESPERTRPISLDELRELVKK